MSTLAVTVDQDTVVVRADAKTARRLADAWALLNSSEPAEVPLEDERWHDDVVHLLHAAIAADPVNQPVPVIVTTDRRQELVPAADGGQ